MVTIETRDCSGATFQSPASEVSAACCCEQATAMSATAPIKSFFIVSVLRGVRGPPLAGG
jgi:hypothetical protein